MSNTAQNNKYHTRLNIYGFWRKDYIYLKQDWEFNYSKFIINSLFEVDGQKPIDEKQHERVVHLTLTRFKSSLEMLNEIQHTVESLTTSLKQNCFSIDAMTIPSLLSLRVFITSVKESVTSQLMIK